MKNGKCLKCNFTKVYFKDYELAEVRVNGKQVHYTAYVCTECGYFESCIADTKALKEIMTSAEKLEDWKKAG